MEVQKGLKRRADGEQNLFEKAHDIQDQGQLTVQLRDEQGLNRQKTINGQETESKALSYLPRWQTAESNASMTPQACLRFKASSQHQCLLREDMHASPD